MSSSKLKNEISVMLLNEPMSLKEIAEEMDIKEKKAYTLLKSMFTDERIISFKDEDGQRKYRLTEKEAEKALKRKERAEKKASKQT
jgi:predicted transcriptional regulator